MRIVDMYKRFKELVSDCAAAWILCATAATVWIFMEAWTSPNHSILIVVNGVNEMWWEVSILVFLFLMFVIWAIRKIREDWGRHR
jgi:hypothetical protein